MSPRFCAAVSAFLSPPPPQARSRRHSLARAAGGAGWSFLVLLGLLLTAATAGCRPKTREVGPAELPVVPVSHPIERVVTDYVDFTGRTDAVQSVNIVARVTGYLVQMPFKEGSEVKAGDLLFEIDPRPYQAQLDEAKSQVKLNEAQLDLAKTTLERYQSLDKTTPGAVSKQALDQYKAAVVEAQARVDSQKKSLEVYKLNKEFTRVVSPIDGQVSRYYLTLGNLVNQDQTLLTTIMSLDPMYAYFDMDERTLLQIRKAIAEGKIATPAGGDITVQLGLQNEDGFPHQGNDQLRQQPGELDDGQHHDARRVREPHADSRDQGFRSRRDRRLRRRERLPLQAPRGRRFVPRLFSPGMFVRVRLPIGARHKALLVIDRAIQSDQGLKYVYVLERRIRSRPTASRRGPCRKTASASWRGK